MISPWVRRRYLGESKSGHHAETSASGFRSLRSLQRAQRACTRCADAGYIARAHPVFSGHAGQRIMLVGQAPGPVEHDQSRPFAGRAGRQLMRWLIRAGFRDEDDVRDRIYMTAMTTCFPGRRPDGAGDRRPSAAEVALCAPWLDGVISHARSASHHSDRLAGARAISSRTAPRRRDRRRIHHRRGSRSWPHLEVPTRARAAAAPVRSEQVAERSCAHRRSSIARIVRLREMVAWADPGG